MSRSNSQAKTAGNPADTVTVEFDRGVAWVTLNRPDKRNAMNPAMNVRMGEILDELEGDDRCGVLVLTGSGDSWCAGMDLKEYFRENDDKPRAVTLKVRRQAANWWNRLQFFEKPTIAMVNGWCFGGAFTPLVSCDIAIASESAQFGLSEINWGIPPGGNVSRALAETIGTRDAMLYIMTGRTFGGQQAARIGLVNESVPLTELRTTVTALADELKGKNPVVLRAAKLGFRHCLEMSWDAAEDYLYAKLEQSQFLDQEDGRATGMQQFLDEKSIRPGLQTYQR